MAAAPCRTIIENRTASSLTQRCTGRYRRRYLSVFGVAVLAVAPVSFTVRPLHKSIPCGESPKFMAHYKKASYFRPTQPPWSKLQRAVYLILAPGLPLQIQCRVYPMDSQFGTTGIPRYWVTLGKEIVWDYPRDFVSQGYLDRHLPYPWPYRTDISEISCLIREYLDTPRSQILSEPFANDLWGIVNVLRAADRRVGSRQWDKLERSAASEAVTKILARRKSERAKEVETPAASA